MSRYKQVVKGEKELKELSGIKFLIYPTIETKMDLLEIVKSTQVFEEIDEKDDTGKIISTKRVKGKYFNLKDIADVCSKIIFEGCFNHDINGKRLGKKSDEQDTTQDQIKELVFEAGVLNVYLEVITSLDIVSADKAEELKEGAAEVEKK